ncbi:hypothetical protein [Tunturiibacter lichenicola]|uniref:hypothetical protein n=1 Tax=Tunturiibacter lichenicola TaxID=2051959 RepID=UPI0021B28618|nr:hypothetical protein [Edaphobacter lichenicola]
MVTEVDEDGGEEDENDELSADEADSTEDELQNRFDRMTFVVTTKKLEQRPQWVKVTDVFKNSSDAPFLKHAGVNSLDDPEFQKYSERLSKLREIKKYRLARGSKVVRVSCWPTIWVPIFPCVPNAGKRKEIPIR